MSKEKGYNLSHVYCQAKGWSNKSSTWRQVGRGGLSLPSTRRHDIGALLVPVTTTTCIENALTTQAMTTVSPRVMALWPDTNLPIESQCAHQEDNERKPMLDNPAPSRRWCNGGTSSPASKELLRPSRTSRRGMSLCSRQRES
jgi:hypothetical protein